MIGYKATDMNGCCRGFQFEVGKTYRKDVKKEDMKCCTNTVFHYCRELFAIEKESNYLLRDSRLFEVIAGDYVRDGDKYGTNELTILREITGEEKENICNSGNYNSGNCNSGHYNSGHCNSGNYNSGNYNSGNCNSGYFNSNSPLIRIFNKETLLKRDEIKFPSTRRENRVLKEQNEELEKELMHLKGCKTCTDRPKGELATVCATEYEGHCIAQKMTYIKELREENEQLKTQIEKLKEKYEKSNM